MIAPLLLAFPSVYHRKYTHSDGTDLLFPLVSVPGDVLCCRCNMGDLLLFVYNYEFKQYTAYLPFKRSLYLLHSESHEELGLISHLVEGDLHGMVGIITPKMSLFF